MSARGAVGRAARAPGSRARVATASAAPHGSGTAASLACASNPSMPAIRPSQPVATKPERAPRSGRVGAERTGASAAKPRPRVCSVPPCPRPGLRGNPTGGPLALCRASRVHERAPPRARCRRLPDYHGGTMAPSGPERSLAGRSSRVPGRGRRAMSPSRRMALRVSPSDHMHA